MQIVYVLSIPALRSHLRALIRITVSRTPPRLQCLFPLTMRPMHPYHLGYESEQWHSCPRFRYLAP